ncbi:Hypothetical protein A7982_03118 [Minicystis rosea]|nr:Hypothetical protein A7982_03118 [Minicystis rosea]
MVARALRPLVRAAVASAVVAAFAAGAAGCFIVTDNGASPAPPSDTPSQEIVDTGASLQVAAGQGAGLFVEYHGDGAWDVYTSCDTDLTNRPCLFDVIISSASGGSIAAPTLHDAEPVDAIELRADGSFRITTGTASRLDGVTFTTDPGASIEIDMLLDGQAQPTFIHWSRDGVAVHGDETTTNPVDFTPTLP